MPITTPRQLSLVILGAYIIAATIPAAMHGATLVVFVNCLVLAAILWAPRSWTITDWLPWLALPVLYWGVPASLSGPMHDATVQHWDFALFHSQPARDLAVALPSRSLSEILHLAYLAYYVVIYLPPVALFFVRRDSEGFAAMTLAFTIAMVISFTGFALLPTQGPRYEWGALSTVPTGPFRSFSLALLARGSSHGTAFPSSHVAIALTQTLTTLRWHRALGIWVAVTTVLLSIGAVFGGFHYATDVLAGAAVGLVAVEISHAALSLPRAKRGAARP